MHARPAHRQHHRPDRGSRAVLRVEQRYQRRGSGSDRPVMETLRAAAGAVARGRLRMAHALLPYFRGEQDSDGCHDGPQAPARGRGCSMHRLRLPSGPAVVATDVLHLRCPSRRTLGFRDGHRRVRADRDVAHRTLGGPFSHPPRRGDAQRRVVPRRAGSLVQPPSGCRVTAEVAPRPSKPPLPPHQHGCHRSPARNWACGRLRRPLLHVEKHARQYPHDHADHGTRCRFRPAPRLPHILRSTEGVGEGC